MRLFLSGVSCVGKTTIGKQLAQEIGFKFFDLDYEVEIYYAQPIEFLQKDFFTMDAFRQKAAVVLEKIIDSNQDLCCRLIAMQKWAQSQWYRNFDMELINKRLENILRV